MQEMIGQTRLGMYADDGIGRSVPISGGEDSIAPIGYVQNIIERWRSWFLY